MRKVTLGDASGFQQLLSAVTFGLADGKCIFVHFHSFGGIEYLYVYLCDAFLDGIFTLGNVELGDAIVQLLLLDGVQTFATVVKGPVGINAITAVVRGFTATAGDVVATDDGTAFTVRAVHNALADTCREAGKKSSLGRFYIYFCAFRTDTVTLQGDVVLQGIVDASLQIPLSGKCSVSFGSGIGCR